jgi:N-terminal domain of ribose phosphate pyrophosphokinase
MTRQSSSHRLRRRESCARRCGCQPSGRRVRWRHPGALPQTTGSCARRSKTSVAPMFMSLHQHHHRSMTTSSNCCCCWTLAAGARAARVTAVVPNFGYAPQDRRTPPGQALGSGVVADAIAAAGADRLVVIDTHTPGLDAQCRVPVGTRAVAGAQVRTACAPRRGLVAAINAVSCRESLTEWVTSITPSGAFRESAASTQGRGGAVPRVSRKGQAHRRVGTRGTCVRLRRRRRRACRCGRSQAVRPGAPPGPAGSVCGSSRNRVL